jgi:hypothetical protein
LEEKSLYEPVQKFVALNYDCSILCCNEAGKQGIGSVDIFGVRYANSKKSEIETIGVEVKIEKVPISVNFGQAKGYSVFCDKVYFASLNKFTEEDKEIARFLGIGLIEIGGENSNFYCTEVLKAPTNMPIASLRDYVINYKGIFQCNECKVFQHLECTEVNERPLDSWTKKKITEDGKGLKIKRRGKEEYYCNTCAKKKLI